MFYIVDAVPEFSAYTIERAGDNLLICRNRVLVSLIGFGQSNLQRLIPSTILVTSILGLVLSD